MSVGADRYIPLTKYDLILNFDTPFNSSDSD